ncbi:MAG: hypothetical protein AAF702_34385 [Chloroflexota bacterium]
MPVTLLLLQPVEPFLFHCQRQWFTFHNEAAEAALSTLIPGVGCLIETGRLVQWRYGCRTGANPADTCTTGRAFFKVMLGIGTCAMPGAGSLLGLFGTVAECMGNAAIALERLDSCQQAGCGLQGATFMPLNVGFAPFSTNSELFNQQVQVLDAYDGLAGAMLGDPKWNDVTQAENGVLLAFYRELFRYMGDESNEGLRISEMERTILLGQARPSTLSEADVNTLLDRMNGLSNGTLPTVDTDAMSAAALRLEELGLELQAAGWETILDGVLNGPKAVAEAAGLTITPARLFYKLENLSSGSIIRGRLNSGGTLDNLIVPPNTLHEISYVHPETLATGHVRVLAGTRGDSTEIPPALLRPSAQADPDGDQLANDAESTLGTDPNRADTDGDGMNDGAEVLAGRDPLGFAIRVGDVISASIDSADEINRYTFTARGDQTIFLDTDGFDGFTGIRLTLRDSRERTIYDDWIHWEPGILTLERGGTYELVVGDGDDEPHPYQIQVWDVPLPDEFDIAIGDVISSSVQGVGAGNIESPGVKDIYTFTAVEGQKVQLVSLLPPGFNSIFWRIEDASGTRLDEDNIHADSGVLTLSAGTYRLIVGNDQHETVGRYAFQLKNAE